jgi:hypothetical protein
MTVRDIRYGHRGGRWATPGTGSHRQALADALDAGRSGHRPVELSAEVLFHPETIARHRAHERGCAHGPNADCLAVAVPGEVAELWAGRARMAAARQPLDRVDGHAPDMHTSQGAAS